jgi:hypothetical protein
MPGFFVLTKIVFMIPELNDEANSPWFGTVIALIVLLLAWLGYHAWYNKDDFRITIRRGKVDFHGRLPHESRWRISEFLLRDQGRVPHGDCQRIRNFMKLTLKG